MKGKKKIEILLKVEKIYSKNPGMQKLIDESLIDVCKEEGVSHEQVFFCFDFLCFCLYRDGLSKHKCFACK